MLGKTQKQMTYAPGARAGLFQDRFSGFGSSNASEPHSSFSQPAAFNGLYPSAQAGETLANYLLWHSVLDFPSIRKSQSKVSQTGRERKRHVGFKAFNPDVPTERLLVVGDFLPNAAYGPPINFAVIAPQTYEVPIDLNYACDNCELMNARIKANGVV